MLWLRLAKLDTPLAGEASVNEALRCRVNIPNVLVLDKRFENVYNLWPLIWHGAKLGLGEKGMEDA